MSSSSVFGASHGHSAAVEAVGLAVAMGAPVLLWGAPGTGKTSAIRSMVEAMRTAEGKGLAFECVIAAVHEPTDFGGLPVVSGEKVRMLPPEWAIRLAEAEEGVLFLDEISTAPPAVQSAVLRVVLERVVGSLRLPPGVRVVAAANPPEQILGGWELTPPLANRFIHIDWAPDAPTVTAGLLSGFAAPEPPVLPEGWFTAHAVSARALVSGYLHARPAAILAVPDEAAAGSRGWPSSRTWEVVIRVLAAAAAAEVSDEARNVLVTGTIGQAHSIEFLSWIDEFDLPDPEKLLADPDSYFLHERGDQQYAVLASVVQAVADQPTADRWCAAWKVLAKAYDAGVPDVAVMAARTLAAVRDSIPGTVFAPPETKKFMAVLGMAGVR